MEFKLKELQNLSNSLEQIIQVEMAQKTAYRLGRIHKKISSELREFNESRAKLEKKYGSYKFKNGGDILTYKESGSGQGSWQNEAGEKVEGVQINPEQIYWKAGSGEDYSLYVKEFTELEESGIKIDFDPVKISDLIRNLPGGQTESINIRPRLISDLEPIFTAE